MPFILSRMWVVRWSRSLQGRSRFLWTLTQVPESRPSQVPSPPCWFPVTSLNPVTLTWWSRTRFSSEYRGPDTPAHKWMAWPMERVTTTEVRLPENKALAAEQRQMFFFKDCSGLFQHRSDFCGFGFYRAQWHHFKETNRPRNTSSARI